MAPDVSSPLAAPQVPAGRPWMSQGQGMELPARLPRPVELPEPVNSNQTFETSGGKADIALVAVGVKVQNHSIYL